MKFLLKQRIGLSQHVERIIYFCLFLGVAFSFIFEDQFNAAFQSFSPNHRLHGYFFFTILSFILVSMIFTFICFCAVDFYRKHVPYTTVDFFENGKTYQLKSYPIYNTKKYYYKGKLHRENGAAWIIYNEKGKAVFQKWFVKGEEIDKSNISLILKQQMIADF